MQPGMNENVEHGGQTLHVQTEDLGTEAAKVVSQIFLGGNVITSQFIDYASAPANGKMAELVTAIMQRQHQKHIQKLLAGKFDATIAEHTATAHGLDGPAAINQQSPDRPAEEEPPAEEEESIEDSPAKSPQALLAELPPPRILKRRIHAQLNEVHLDPLERELQVIEDVVEHRSDMQLSSPQSDSIEAAMHSLFDNE